MEIRIIKDPITKEDLAEIAKNGFGEFVKAVVDLEQGIMAVGGELHADEEVVLSEQHGSKRENVWGINIYPEKSGEEWIEFNSMVNIKPHLGNRSRDIADEVVKEKVRSVVKKLVSQ